MNENARSFLYKPRCILFAVCACVCMRVFYSKHSVLSYAGIPCVFFLTRVFLGRMLLDEVLWGKYVTKRHLKKKKNKKDQHNFEQGCWCRGRMIRVAHVAISWRRKDSGKLKSVHSRRVSWLLGICETGTVQSSSILSVSGMFACVKRYFIWSVVDLSIKGGDAVVRKKYMVPRRFITIMFSSVTGGVGLLLCRKFFTSPHGRYRVSKACTIRCNYSTMEKRYYIGRTVFWFVETVYCVRM